MAGNITRFGGIGLAGFIHIGQHFFEPESKKRNCDDERQEGKETTMVTSMRLFCHRVRAEENAMMYTGSASA